MKNTILIVGFCIFGFVAKSQLFAGTDHFTRADTLRGSITKYRQGWDVKQYELTVKPDIINKTLSGVSKITYFESLAVKTMQIDLQQPLIVDSVVSETNHSYSFSRDSNVCFVYLRDSLAMYKIKPGLHSLSVYYHGKPKEAKRAPWDGGLVWNKDSLGNPWVSTACQGLGASVWWPNKDHQSDEPDSGMIIHIIAPDTLQAISNGRLKQVTDLLNGSKEWTWQTKAPINNYDICMNIGKYEHWHDTIKGVAGILDLDFWVLAYNLKKAKIHFQQAKDMLHSHEYWFGKYPFYQDGYKLVETPFLGMEHQSAVAYGNKFQNGYLGRDMSGSGWGLKWDYIIIHESGHEWFGNNITTNDIADMWVHEGFTCYSETLFTEYMFGKKAANEYVTGSRGKIKNSKPVIGFYGVNKEGSGDMYSKGANMLQTIRHSINNDKLFRNILHGLNSTYYHKTVNSSDIENYISTYSHLDFSKVFDQYLRTIQIPQLDYYYGAGNKKFYYKWSNTLPGFNLPIVLHINKSTVRFAPGEKWQSITISPAQFAAGIPKLVVDNYYVTALEFNK